MSIICPVKEGAATAHTLYVRYLSVTVELKQYRHERGEGNMVDCCSLAAGERLMGKVGESTNAFSLKRPAKMRELRTERV
jgi:hypothetical protein